MIPKTVFVLIADEFFPYLTDDQIDTLYLRYNEGERKNEKDLIQSICKHIISETIINERI